jgi:hypothetical protein
LDKRNPEIYQKVGSIVLPEVNSGTKVLPKVMNTCQ